MKNAFFWDVTPHVVTSQKMAFFIDLACKTTGRIRAYLQAFRYNNSGKGLQGMEILKIRLW
jgi:hypothetical protein